MGNQYYLYILSNFTRTTLYIGLTSNLHRRLQEHTNGEIKGFSKKYNLKYLMYYEIFEDVHDAIQREKSLKGQNRSKKEKLINSMNPEWDDLSQTLL